LEIILFIIYLFLFYLLAFVIKRSISKDIRGYFIPALSLKLVGAVALGLIYFYYYGYGDTLRYHFHSRIISKTFWEDPVLGLRLMTINLSNPDPNLIIYFTKNYFFGVKDPGGFLMIRICGFLGIFTAHSYFIIALFFAVMGFAGTWALFYTFYKLFPKLKKQIAIVVLFIPSVIFWGSGILKDTLTFSALGFLVYCIYSIFFAKKRTLFIFLLLIGNIWLLITLKIYIILCFLPAASLWIFTSVTDKIKSRGLKPILKFGLILISVPIAWLLVSEVSEVDSRYAVENLGETAQITAEWITYSSGESGSAYSLGDMTDFSLIGILSKIPLAINVTLFRPYVWEVKNIVMLFAALESLVVLLFTMQVILKTGFFPFIKIINTNSIALFLAVFSLTFAFAVGFSTYNFGSLVRYKIPCIPFYLLLLIIVKEFHHRSKLKKKMLAFM